MTAKHLVTVDCQRGELLQHGTPDKPECLSSSCQNELFSDGYISVFNNHVCDMHSDELDFILSHESPNTNVSHCMFNNCLDMCQNPSQYPQGIAPGEIDLTRLNPLNLRLERQSTWPNIDHNCVVDHACSLYDMVKASGLPNALYSKFPITSGLKIEEWRALATGHHDDSWLCELLEYGFPLQYSGYAPTSLLVDNHSSAVAHPKHIQSYISKEIKEGALLDPP